MTFDKALNAVRLVLEYQGRLRNAQILELVGGDEALLEQVRESLIFDNLAVDKSGAGLVCVRLRPSSQSEPADALFAQQVEHGSDVCWEIQCFGEKSGQFLRNEVIALIHRGDLARDDLVRASRSASWARTADVPEFRAEFRRLSGQCVPASLTPVGTETQHAHSHVAPARQESAPAPPPQHYFLWESGKEQGPLHLEELQRRVESGQLSAEHFARTGARGGDWLPIGKLAPSLFPDASTAAGLENDNISRDEAQDVAITSTLASDSLPGKPRPDRSVPRPSPAADTASVRDVMAATVPEFAARPASRSPRVRYWSESDDVPHRSKHGLLASIQSQPIRWVAATLAVVATFAVWTRSAPSELRVYNEFMGIWKSYEVLKETRAGPDEWRDFCERSVAQVEPLVNELEEYATAEDPVRQELFWAGKYCLIGLLRGRGGGQTEREEAFLRHMDRARRFREGDSVGDESLAENQAADAKSEGDSADPTSSALIVLESMIPPGAPGFRPLSRPGAVRQSAETR